MVNVNTKQVVIYIYKAVNVFPKGLFIMLITAAMLAVNISAGPFFLKIIFNKVSENSPQIVFKSVIPIVFLYLLSPFLLFLCHRIYDYFVEIKMIPHLKKNITIRSFECLLGQSQCFFDAHLSGSVVNKINDLTNGVPQFVQILIDRFLANFLAITIAIFLLGYVNIYFALVMSFWAYSFLLSSILIAKKLSAYSIKFSEINSSVAGLMIDILSNILFVKIFNNKEYETTKMQNACDLSISAERKLQWCYFWVWLWYGASFIILQGISFYILLIGRENGWVTIGDFVLVLTVNTSIFNLLWNLTKEFSVFSKLFGKITHALKSILSVPVIQEIYKAKALDIKRGEIIFENVEFRYNDSGLLFKNKSIEIYPGQKIGLVGYSGSGKSTFVKLILRLFDVKSGRILVDGQDVRYVTLDSLNKAIGIIPQESSLFNRTIEENIRYGCIGASYEEMIDAARKANAHDFIVKLPLGYQTLVGERGLKLSGGERQRILISRAILKDAPILILDEATAHLDSITEMRVQSALKEIMKNKTTIVIAHRISTLLEMDRILLFSDGEIIADGPHQELINGSDLYRLLWKTQADGYIPMHTQLMLEEDLSIASSLH